MNQLDWLGSGITPMVRVELLLAGLLLGCTTFVACAFAQGSADPARPTSSRPSSTKVPDAAPTLYSRENLIAWCIVPFDSKRRSPEERAVMLKRLGFRRFAYDWRAEHMPSFDAETEALRRHGIRLEAFWVAPGEINRESRIILDLLKRHGEKTQLWVLLDVGADRALGAEQERRVKAAAAKLGPLAREAEAIGCSLALYNHGGWFGEPENQIAIIEQLKAQGITNVGMVYNLHHGHDHLPRFAALLPKMMPYLKALNLNGMDPAGDRHGRKILQLGQGSLDLELLKTIRESGYKGPIGILGHTMDDAEARLQDNLDGLDWLLPQLDGRPAGQRPAPRTPVPPPPPAAPAPAPAPKPGAAARTGGRARHIGVTPSKAARIATLLRDARELGDPLRGASVFASPQFACISCHRVLDQGGLAGPDLSTVGICLKPEELVESILWPRHQVRDGYAAVSVATNDGRVRQGYTLSETGAELVLRDPSSGDRFSMRKADVLEVRQDGTLMPDGLADAMSANQRRDLVRFLLDLGQPGKAAAAHLAAHSATPAPFSFDRAPLEEDHWPGWREPVNRERIYDFYTKEAEYFLKQPKIPPLLPQFPGLDGGRAGHWGNQNEDTWADARWNQTDLGTVLCGVFRGAGVTVPKGVCLRLGEHGELAACFNPETLTYDALWQGGFVNFSPVRHGILGGLLMDGTPLARPEYAKPDRPFVYHGFYRHGKRVVFAYRLGDTEMLDAPWVDNGRFTRVVAPADRHPFLHMTRGGAAQWPQVFRTQGKLGLKRSWPYVIDTIEPPFDNPWKALLFFGGHDFFSDGAAMLCTIQGDVWRVDGLDQGLENVRWRRFASGLHQALGLVIAGGQVYVLGRDQITRLHDLDGDGEADFYECFSNAFGTSTAGHDFLSGLERDAAGRFYTASSNLGLLQIAADGKSYETLATGFRNPDGLGLAPDGTVTVPNSEGESVPASMICEVRPGGHYGYPGPRDGRPPDLPLVYLPRGLDNSSASQVTVPDGRFGPLEGQLLHLSFGMGAHLLVLRSKVGGQPQGAVVPLPGEFRSGAHRARFNPADGQLYVSGMAGWGTYTVADGCFQRVRFTGGQVQLPVSFQAHENGVLLTFALPVDREAAKHPNRHFAQAWNYRYSASYGSPELSSRHPSQPGHDPLAIASAPVLADGRSLFLEIPEIQPVNQLHLHVRPDTGRPIDLFATIHRLAAPFTGFPGYRPTTKTIAAHPVLADMATWSNPPPPNPWRRQIRGARAIMIEAGKNLSYSVRSFAVKAGEPIGLTLINPDAVPHNWALVKPGATAAVGDLINKFIAEPDAAQRQYIPRTEQVLAYTDIVPPQDQFTIFFRAPSAPGRYPYLCTFPGHWMVMNGEMIVE
jgi:putative heme-binding domain-containing protein